MRASQAEIKAIEAKLRSIRADTDRRHRVPPTVPSAIPSTVLEPYSTQAHPRPGDPRGQSRGRSTPAPHYPSSPQPQSHVAQNRSAVARSTVHRSPPSTRVQSYPGTPERYSQEQLVAVVERLQQQSAAYVQQFQRLQSQPFQPPEHTLNRTMQVLAAQAHHINQLSDLQEAAILELKKIAEKVEHDWRMLDQASRHEPHPSRSARNSMPVCEYLETAVPRVEKDENGVYVLTSRPIDVFKAEREAALTAQALRHWAERKKPDRRSSPSIGRQIWHWLMHGLTPTDSHDRPPPEPAPQGRSHPRSPPHPEPYAREIPDRVVRRRSRARRSSGFNLREGVAVFLGAIIIRAVLDMVLTAFPVLWTPAVALLVTPAAIAVYRTSRTPRSGFVWVYRLSLIMLGLLVGGRL